MLLTSEMQSDEMFNSIVFLLFNAVSTFVPPLSPLRMFR